jgi:hypothetical protein
MKNKSIVLLALLFALASLNSCKKCKNEDPISRIVNNGTQSTSVQIQTSGGNTVNINNILPGEVSEDKSFAVGDVTFTISIGNNSPVELLVPMLSCWEYEIIVDANDNVSSVPKDRNDK